MKKLTDFLSKSDIGRVILMVVNLIMNYLGFGPLTDPYVKYGEKIGASKGNKAIGFVLFGLGVAFAVLYLTGNLTPEEIDAAVDAIESLKEIEVKQDSTLIDSL